MLYRYWYHHGDTGLRVLTDTGTPPVSVETQGSHRVSVPCLGGPAFFFGGDQLFPPPLEESTDTDRPLSRRTSDSDHEMPPVGSDSDRECLPRTPKTQEGL